jgi:putative flippase GtrA
VLHAVLSRLPRPVRDPMYRHKELVKFAVVGGTAFVVDTAIFEGLMHTVLTEKPIVSKIIGTMVATVVSYILNREWSFRTRGGRVRHHEALLFFVISGLGIAVTSAPLAVSRYLLDLWTARGATPFTQEVADFVSAQVIGTILAMIFRWWAFRKFVFPHADARPRTRDEELDLAAAELLGDVWPLIDEPDGTDVAERIPGQDGVNGSERISGSDRQLLESEDTEDPLRTR